MIADIELEQDTSERFGDGVGSSSLDLNLREKEPIPLWERKIVAVPVLNTWPAPVRSHMNVSVWKEPMKEAGLSREIPYITNGFKSGFCLGIPQHEIGSLKWYTPDNHKSAAVAQE